MSVITKLKTALGSWKEILDATADAPIRNKIDTEILRLLSAISELETTQEPVEELTDSQIMASVGRATTTLSESRPVYQQWDLICNLVREIMRERCYIYAPQPRQTLTDEEVDDIVTSAIQRAERPIGVRSCCALVAYAVEAAYRIK